MRDRRQTRWAEQFGARRPNDRDRDDCGVALRERKEQQCNARRNEGRSHDRKCADAIAQLSGDWTSKDCGRSVHGKHEARSRSREAKLAREVEHEEREDHHPRPVDEIGREQQPDLARQSAESAPRVQARLRKRKRPPIRWPFRFIDSRLSCQGHSAPCRNRTCNLMIKSHLLCQLS